MNTFQTFKWTNSFKQVKSMNEYRFRVFFTYLIDMYNLKHTGQLHITHPTGYGALLPDPIINQLKSLSIMGVPRNCDENISLKKNIVPEDQPEEKLICTFCGRQDFKSKRGLTQHMNSTHSPKKEQPSAIPCQKCPKICNSQSGFTRHIKAKHSSPFNIRTQ